ncbi:lysosomal Pro-X carboxypeptidase-like [Adelges cooleyi]|uniref:lysosomal Pro-X carboxypeptidase-like n=1 Tax=Adelges cooleyi TaxID=133065 RepID=UPI00217FDF2F|nr:lysosomal Pro-X carboxypeptidase-like [Adelges cooleyi]XP_050441622.1 lysosomal Pro-X carboxypeptidase-like [Adelges cooleyi]XP_050441623.1 lysosomal Pro-X carboxypeptidase-like [Adelges cooleyi]XP_050441624.1 lysosomal Pro-X carboxypeptidase-like [Adelges cooleyi]
MNNLLLILLVITFKVSLQSYVYQTKYFTVPVDHFSFTQNNTFQMKYLINDSYWDSTNGPIFFYTGNEGAIEMFCENTGFMWEIAEEFKALLVFAEHRYYGDSMPYGNASFDDKQRLGYLTSQQALADYVDLIEYLRQKKVEKLLTSTDFVEYDTQTVGSAATRSNPVIVFGGSYGGMLSAWFRMKYPASVEGAIASSAPIWQFNGMTPCNAFYRVTSSVYMTTSKECGQTIRSSWKAIDNVTSTDEGKEWLSKQWKLCSPLTNSDDVSKLKGWASEVYVNMAMINYPYPANFLMPLPGNPIKEFCKPLTNSQSDYYTLLSSVFEGLNVYFNYTGSSQCLDALSTATPSLGEKGWSYQACTEMVMPMCANGIKDIFETSPWNFDDFAQQCYNQYGVYPAIDLAKKIYGGKHLLASSNIIFSNGLLDPWSSGGVLYNISNTVQAVIIPESAHHLDLRASNAEDPQSVIEARKYYKNSIRKWIDGYRKNQLNRDLNRIIDYTIEVELLKNLSRKM